MTKNRTQCFSEDKTGRTKDRDNPRAYDNGAYPWCIRRVPKKLKLDGTEVDHPGRTCGIFVVHGIGAQVWTETAVQLRSGFEDALDTIEHWQCKNPDSEVSVDLKGPVPPPFIWEGYWANYEVVEETFPQDWSAFEEREKMFFGRLWKVRTQSLGKILKWFIRQQLGLLSPRVFREIGPLAWLLYLPLQIVSLVSLVFGSLTNRKLITTFLGDVRMYVERGSMVEKAIVQRIDDRVGESFLRMIGLGWDFRELPEDRRITASGERLVFKRVVWVAHSLGTVVSYNVLSDIFHRAAELELTGDEAQKRGVVRFRESLSRFVTMGSPLDKVAFLFPGTLRPWPNGMRRKLVKGGETLKTDPQPNAGEWWINFYHILDPVSAALTNPVLFGDDPPANFHIKSGCVPGLAHTAYWNDKDVLRFILGRTYGKTYLRDKEYLPWSPVVQQLLGLFGYFIWAVVLFGLVYVIVARPEWIKTLYEKVRGVIAM